MVAILIIELYKGEEMCADPEDGDFSKILSFFQWDNGLNSISICCINGIACKYDYVIQYLLNN